MGKLRQAWADRMLRGLEAHQFLPAAWKDGKKGALAEGAVKKQETIEQLSWPCARDWGCPLPFHEVPATRTPLPANLCGWPSPPGPGVGAKMRLLPTHALQ